jgi:hypothetical protein
MTIFRCCTPAQLRPRSLLHPVGHAPLLLRPVTHAMLEGGGVGGCHSGAILWLQQALNAP